MPTSVTIAIKRTFQARHILSSLIVPRKFFYKSPSIWRITERLIKSMCLYACQSGCQRKASHPSLCEIPFCCGYKRATDATPSVFLRNYQRDDFAGRIVVLVAGVRQRANHPTDLIVDFGDKCAKNLIAQDGS